MHLTLRDRHLGGKLHPHWKWFYAVLLTKSLLPRKSQASYLEHPSQMKPRYFSNGTKMAKLGSEGSLFLLLWVLHHYRSYMEWALHPLHPKTLNGYSQVSYPRTSKVLEEAWAPGGTTGLDKQHSGQIWVQFSPEGTHCKAANIYQKPQVFRFSWLSKQPLGKPFEEYTNSCLFIFYWVSLRAQTFASQWVPKCFSTLSDKVGKCQKDFNISIHFLQAVSESVEVRIKGLVSIVWNYSLITIFSYKKTLYQ